jgi:hypothetical protein
VGDHRLTDPGSSTGPEQRFSAWFQGENTVPNPLTAVLRCTSEPASTQATRKGGCVSLLWIILIVILVLALLGFFSRGRW